MESTSALRNDLLSLGDRQVLKDRTACGKVARRIMTIYLPLDGASSVFDMMAEVAFPDTTLRHHKHAICACLCEFLIAHAAREGMGGRAGRGARGARGARSEEPGLAGSGGESLEALASLAVHRFLLPFGGYVLRLEPEKRKPFIKVLDELSRRQLVHRRRLAQVRAMWQGQ